MNLRNLVRNQFLVRLRQLIWRGQEARGAAPRISKRAPKFPRYRFVLPLVAEVLPCRVLPSVGFDPGTGALIVTGDDNGPTNDKMIVNSVAGGYVQVVLDGSVHTSNPDSAKFDPALAGASTSTVLSILMQGGAGNDKMLLNGSFLAAVGAVTMDGGAGNDMLSCKTTDAVLLGGDGNDKLKGGLGNDDLEGGDGNDVLNGGAGDDSEDGGTGDDTCLGGDGNDTLQGDDGNDLLNGGAGDDSEDGGAGNDDCLGDQGDDNLQGGEGDDTLDGGAGNDELQGDAGNDTLQGDAGNDDLQGDEGDDNLNGGAGQDSANSDEGDAVEDCEATSTEFAADLTSSTGATGSAEFETKDGQAADFEVEVYCATPGDVLDVAVDGVVVGQVTVDECGNAELTFTADSNDDGGTPFPAAFPTVQDGSVITVGTVLQGTFTIQD